MNNNNLKPSIEMGDCTLEILLVADYHSIITDITISTLDFCWKHRRIHCCVT